MSKFIAILLPDLGIGGAERVSIDLAREFVRRGYRVEFVLMRRYGEFLKEVPEGVDVVDLKAPKLRNFAGPFARYLRERAPDVVLANLWPLTAVAVLVANVIGSKKTRIVTVDHAALSIQYANWGAVNWAALRASIALIYPFAYRRIAVSHGVAEDVSALGGRKSDFADVVFNPVPKPVFHEDAHEAAEKAWNGWRGPRLLTVGTLKKEKNHAMLLRAIKTLVQKRDARLIILGAGDLFDDVAALISEMKLGEKVILPGPTRFPGPFYNSADLFILSSDHEGFGNVIVEAMACGLPVVSTDCKSGPREILDNGRYGVLTPVGDADALAQAILKALNKSHDREALRRRAADFSPEIAATKYLRIMFPDLPV
jgi:glycosyltransferase involved in cell wall biosynthesis